MTIKTSPRRKVLDCLGDGWRMDSCKFLMKNQKGILFDWAWSCEAWFEDDYEIHTKSHEIAREIDDALGVVNFMGYTITVV